MQDNIINYLQEELLRLENILVSAKNDVKAAPKGSLRVAGGKKNPEFYHRKTKEDRLGAYIPKDQIRIARELAQKTYAEKLVKTIDTKIGMINNLIAEYEANSLRGTFLSQTAIRQQLTTPYILPDKEYAERWLSVPYEPNPKHAEHRDQCTANGEMVRSKSEVIIADNLKMMNIPYKYEAPLKLSNGVTIYPDFTCLNVKRREVIFLEHFGRMGDPEYRDRDFFWKLKNYEASGILQGKRLIMTFEDEDHTFNFSSYKNTIEAHLLR